MFNKSQAHEEGQTAPTAQVERLPLNEVLQFDVTISFNYIAYILQAAGVSLSYISMQKQPHDTRVSLGLMGCDGLEKNKAVLLNTKEIFLGFLEDWHETNHTAYKF